MTTVLSGRDGSLSFEGRRIGKVKSWQLQRSRERLDNTTLDSWDESWVPGKRAGAATATILYDSSETDTADLLNNILINKPPKSLLGLYLRTPDVGFDVPAYIESITPSVAVGNASAVEVKFKIPAAGVRLILSGPSRVYINDIRSFSAEVAGVEGAWSFYWEATSTPVIATPNDQTTNITFPGLGTARIQVTATLGSLVLTDYIDVVVDDYPYFWLASSVLTNYSVVGVDCASQAIADNGDIYYALPFSSPSDTSKHLALLKFNTVGTLLWIKRISSSEGLTFPPGASLQPYGTGMAVCPMDDGGVTLIFAQNYTKIYIIRVSSTGTLMYARSHDYYAYNWTCNSLYVPTHNAIYTGNFYISGGFGRGAARAYKADTGELISQIDDLSDSLTFPEIRTEDYISANWPRSIAYNPLNDTVVMAARHGADPDGIDFHETEAFFRAGGNPAGAISVNSYRLNNSTGMIGSGGGRSLAINANGEMYTNYQDGIMIMDATFNCIKAVRRNTTETAGVGDGQELGSALLASGEYVTMKSSIFGPTIEIYSADLSTRQGVTMNGSGATANNYNWGSTMRLGGSRHKSVNANSQTLAWHLGQGFVGARIFIPPGTYDLLAAPGSDRGIRVISNSPTTTIDEPDLMTTSVISFVGESTEVTSTDIASLITIGDETEIDEWQLATYAAV